MRRPLYGVCVYVRARVCHITGIVDDQCPNAPGPAWQRFPNSLRLSLQTRARGTDAVSAEPTVALQTIWAASFGGSTAVWLWLSAVTTTLKIVGLACRI